MTAPAGSRTTGTTSSSGACTSMNGTPSRRSSARTPSARNVKSRLAMYSVEELRSWRTDMPSTRSPALTTGKRFRRS